MAQILAIGTTRAEQIPLRFSVRTTYRDFLKKNGGTCLSGSFMYEIVTLITVLSKYMKTIK